MRCLVLATLLLAACQSPAKPAAPVAGSRPDVPVALALPPGTRLLAELQGPLPDEPLWRAAEVWWREALRQTARFEVVDRAPRDEALASVRLSLDPATRRLAAFCRLGDGREQALAGGTFEEGLLPEGVDRLAWAARCALGEEAEPPVPTAACVSASPGAVIAAVDGHALLRDGAVHGALRAFRDARVIDGGSPFVLDGLASAELLRGEAGLAERLCSEALGFTQRLSPTTQHRLARTLLLARASTRPEAARQRDEELRMLGEACLRERPHDPQGALTVALANNFLGRFAEARAQFERLQARLPDQAVVDYHLGWSCLATGDAATAAGHFERAAARLPMPWVAVPRCIALFAADRQEELGKLLQRFVDETGPKDFGLRHDLLRMQAAHALLRSDFPAAADLVLEDLNWLLRNPSLLETRAGELAEQGTVLVRLGRATSLPPLLAAFQNQHPGTLVADTCAYLAGLVQVASTRQRAESLEKQLGRGGDSAFGLLLAAFAHEQRGEIADMNEALSRAARLSDTPLTKAMLARSLRAMGRTTDADALRDALQRELLAIDLRRRPQHPLLGPELAFAFRAE